MRRCVQTCTNIAYAPLLSDTDDDRKNRYACIDGTSTSCATLDDTHCEVCGCTSNTMVCHPGGGCGPKHEVGDPCTSDVECKSNSCSTAAGVCRVAAGQACNATNCDLCRSDPPTGVLYCSRICSYDAQCNGGLCMNEGTRHSCYPSCSGVGDPSCAGLCLSRIFAGETRYFCGCDAKDGKPPLCWETRGS